MTHEEFTELLDVPPELRTPEEVEAMASYLRAHPEVAPQVDHLERALASFVAAPDPQPHPRATAALRRRIDGGPEHIGSRLTRWLRERLWVPALAAAALLLVLLPRGEDGPHVRTRGEGAGPPSQLSLHAAVERTGGGAPEALRTGGQIVAGQGLLFQVTARGHGTLRLLERGPTGASVPLFEWDLDARTEPRILTLEDNEGQLLRYTPDSGPGTYTYRVELRGEGAEALLSQELSIVVVEPSP